MSNQLSIGIDGCKGGWLAVSMTSLKKQKITLLENIQEIKFLLSSDAQVWLDMPIGLSEGKIHRDLEAYARPLLKPFKASSIFTPPCRDAVYQADYQSAKAANLKQCGKSISIQSWNISNKIREVDEWLLANIPLQEQLFEAHPEICFTALNGMKPLQSNKQTAAGQEERLALLQTYLPNTSVLYQQAMQAFARKVVKRDDILDAICLALCAFLSKEHGRQLIQGKTAQDAQGLFMRMAYPNIP